MCETANDSKNHNISLSNIFPFSSGSRFRHDIDLIINYECIIPLINKMKKTVSFCERVEVYLIPSRKENNWIQTSTADRSESPVDDETCIKRTKRRSKYVQFSQFTETYLIPSRKDLSILTSDLWYASDEIRFFQLKTAIKYERWRQQMFLSDKKVIHDKISTLHKNLIVEKC